jgi:hypothetical protein
MATVLSFLLVFLHSVRQVSTIQELNFLYFLFRFRTNNKILKIRSVEAHDSGVYYCKGINGFGTAEVRIDLMVIGKG